MTSMFREIIEFFGRLGIYDVILPFLLVFSITFAILEKTRIFGTMTIDGVEYTRKSYNSIVAFCLGFMVVASTQLVAIINEGMARVAIIMVAFVSFMITIGVFYGQEDNIFGDEGVKKMRPWIVSLTFVAMVFIMLSVIKTGEGHSWLEILYGVIVNHWDSTAVGSIILFGLLIGFMAWITKSPKTSSGNEGGG
ncbi:MAG: hypothetical protein ACLFTR_02955 [Candidatus Woesearchaeota archaeon]